MPLRPTRSWPVMKITCEDRWPGPKEDWKRGGWMEQKKTVAHREIREVIKIKTVHPKLPWCSLNIKGCKYDPFFKA